MAWLGFEPWSLTLELDICTILGEDYATSGRCWLPVPYLEKTIPQVEDVGYLYHTWRGLCHKWKMLDICTILGEEDYATSERCWISVPYLEKTMPPVPYLEKTMPQVKDVGYLYHTWRGLCHKWKMLAACTVLGENYAACTVLEEDYATSERCWISVPYLERTMPQVEDVGCLYRT